MRTSRKTDAELQRDVIAEPRWYPRVHEDEIAVAVQDGVATLAGTVQSYAQQRAAEQAAKRVSGVNALADGLSVELPGDRTRRTPSWHTGSSPRSTGTARSRPTR